MGSNVREKALRGGRKSRHTGKPPAPPAAASECLAEPLPNSGTGDEQTPGGWGYCTEEQLEELLLKNLEIVYKEAISRLVSLGYDEATALRAILRSGHCYGSMDVLSNILHNAMPALGTVGAAAEGGDAAAGSAAGFSDLRHLEEYSLAGMVCLLQQVRPHLTRGDAMWCLLMADLHVGRASTIEIPPPPDAAAPGGTAIGDQSQLAAAFQRHADILASLCPPACSQTAPALPSSSEGEENNVKDDSDLVSSVMKSLESMSIEEVVENGEEDPKKEMILDLVRQVRELEVQVKDRKDWAQQKAMQAARRLSSDMAELKQLRMEKEDNQRVKKGKQVLEDATMKRLAEMEAALRKASSQVDRANAEVKRLEAENAEIRAEMEASKLSAAESVTACLEVAKREKKCLKKLLVWEKQKERLQEEIAVEKRKIVETEKELLGVQDRQKEYEKKLKAVGKAKEQAIAEAEEERRAKEAAEINVKRRNEALRSKLDLDLQCHKDDIRRLEEEYACLQALAQAKVPSSNAVPSGDACMAKTAKEANQKTPHGSNRSQGRTRKPNYSRQCITCRKDEVSVVFLPCTHQVLCANCSEEHATEGKGNCLCCNDPIEERIRIYGVSA